MCLKTEIIKFLPQISPVSTAWMTPTCRREPNRGFERLVPVFLALYIFRINLSHLSDGQSVLIVESVGRHPQIK